VANEFQQLPNPDNMPGPVTSGYQRQNTNIFSIQTGLDTTEPYDNGQGVISIPVGGIIELNGVMFKLISGISLSKPSMATAYWVAITDDGYGNASASLVTRPGIWNSSKKGCYTNVNTRTLNWVSLGDVDNLIETPIFSQTVKGTWNLKFQKGWYCADLSSGLGGGDGSNGVSAGNSNIRPGGAGGVPYLSKKVKRPFFSDGKSEFVIKVGGNGYPGGNGGAGGARTSVYDSQIGGGGGGGGGGSGAGEETTVNTISTGEQSGGNGGNGERAAGIAADVGGGGGGGGIIGGNPGTGDRNGRAGTRGTNKVDSTLPFGAGGGNGGDDDWYNGGNGGAGGNGPGNVGGAGIAGGGIQGGSGGGGGGQGGDGTNRPNGSPNAGYANICPLGN